MTCRNQITVRANVTDMLSEDQTKTLTSVCSLKMLVRNACNATFFISCMCLFKNFGAFHEGVVVSQWSVSLSHNSEAEGLFI